MKNIVYTRAKSIRYGRSQRGYLLIETMVALLIAAIGVVGLGTAMKSATGVGISAHQFSLLTIAQRSVLAELRLFARANPATTSSYRFDSQTPEPANPRSSLSGALQHQVDLLSSSFDDIHSTINCLGTAVTRCEVCFHWFDASRDFETATRPDVWQDAANRNTCQVQIV